MSGQFSRNICRHLFRFAIALAVAMPLSGYAQDSSWRPDTWEDRYIRDEAATLASASTVAQRLGPVLKLKLRAGFLDLEDARDCGDENECRRNNIRLNCSGDVGECKSHIFMSYQKDAGAYVVMVGFYEGGTVYWIDETTGQVTDINGEPHFSPDGIHFAIVQTVDAYSYSGIQIWRSKGPTLVNEYRELNPHYPNGPRIYANFIRWLDNNSFLISTHWNNETSGTTSLVQRDGVWVPVRPPAEFTVPMKCLWGSPEPTNTTGSFLPLKLPDGYVCIEDNLRTHVETEVKHCAFSAAASPCENIEIPRVR